MRLLGRSKKLLFVFFTLVAVGLGVFIRLSKLPVQSVLLSNGSVLNFKGVSFGTVHVQPSDKMKYRFLQLLPTGLRSNISARLQPIRLAQLSTNSVGVWVENVGVTNKYGGPIRLWARAIEDQGDCAAEWQSWSWMTSGKDKLYFIPISISSTGKNITLGVFDMPNGWLEFEQIAEFRIQNPKSSQ